MLVDVKEAARRLDVSVVTVRRLIAARELAHVRIGTRVKVSEEALAAFVRANEEGGSGFGRAS